MKRTIQEIRESKNESREWLAWKLGVTSQTIYNWENGTAEPSNSSKLAVATVLGVPLEEIIFLSKKHI